MANNTEPGSSQAAAQQPAKNKKAPSNAAEKKEIKILMLHGYAQTGPLFRAKTGAMSKMLAKALPTIAATRIYPTAPHKLQPADIPGFQPAAAAAAAAATATASEAPPPPPPDDAYGWFLHDDHPQPGPLRGFDEGMRAIATAIADAGGVDGVLGFSQGGAVAAMVAAALEPDRPLPPPPPEHEEAEEWVVRLRAANRGRPLRFCVVYSGFVPPAAAAAAACEGAGLGWLYEGGIRTPSCHFFGSADAVVEEARCRALAARFVGAEAFVHPGGHHVPVRKEWVAPLVGFLRKVLVVEREEGGGG